MEMLEGGVQHKQALFVASGTGKQPESHFHVGSGHDCPDLWMSVVRVGFRVSPEENELINKAVALSGLPKQEYCYRRCLNQDVVVQGNPRIFKALKTELATVLTELKRIEAGNGVDEELLNVIELIAVIMGGLKGEDEDGK